jgi:hypothetical protein
MTLYLDYIAPNGKLIGELIILHDLEGSIRDLIEELSGNLLEVLRKTREISHLE